MFALESGARPDGAPASFGYELLHGTREVARAILESGVDVCRDFQLVLGMGCEMRGLKRSGARIQVR